VPIDGTPLPFVTSTPLFAVVRLPSEPALSYRSPLLVPLTTPVVPGVIDVAVAVIEQVEPSVQFMPLIWTVELIAPSVPELL